MLRGGNELKIFDSVIERVAVYVVNLLHASKWTTDVLLHNPSVLLNRPSADANVLVRPSIPFRMRFSIDLHGFVFARSAITAACRRILVTAATGMLTFHVYHHASRNII